MSAAKPSTVEKLWTTPLGFPVEPLEKRIAAAPVRGTKAGVTVLVLELDGTPSTRSRVREDRVATDRLESRLAKCEQPDISATCCKYSGDSPGPISTAAAPQCISASCTTRHASLTTATTRAREPSSTPWQRIDDACASASRATSPHEISRPCSLTSARAARSRRANRCQGQAIGAARDSPVGSPGSGAQSRSRSAFKALSCSARPMSRSKNCEWVVSCGWYSKGPVDVYCIQSLSSRRR
mmetsp:Transcript_58616/g.116262  ORF Transcript_58616/g.116262 Transcript_58616/m.116262 type:complete len:240 (-) Transcript_58616:2389-3108(-)